MADNDEHSDQKTCRIVVHPRTQKIINFEAGIKQRKDQVARATRRGFCVGAALGGFARHAFQLVTNGQLEAPDVKTFFFVVTGGVILGAVTNHFADQRP